VLRVAYGPRKTKNRACVNGSKDLPVACRLGRHSSVRKISRETVANVLHGGVDGGNRAARPGAGELQCAVSAAVCFGLS
ncbi:unnamed protein product, partial [Symbiodinium microadriaticum]